jgi:hypothetical protein
MLAAIRTAVLALLPISIALPQQQPRQPHTYLKQVAKLNDSQIASIEAGNSYAQVVETGDNMDVFLFGAVYIKAPIESFARLYQDMNRLRETSEYLAIGRFSNPAKLSDVAQLQFDPADIDALKSCNPGDCEIQLSEDAIRALRSQVDWSAPGYRNQVNLAIRKRIVSLIDRYRKNGDQELTTYVDKDYPVAITDAFRISKSRMRPLFGYFPDLRTYLLNYPKAKLANSSDYFYWEQVKFGLKPTLRINHVVIQRTAPAADSTYAVVNKQLYASHYFLSALDVWVCARDSANPKKPGFFLITEKASRQHGLTGLKGGLMRAVAVPRARDSLQRSLDGIKRELEKKR